MQKLLLNLEDLDVQSFDTTPAPRGLRCTVRGHQMESYDELRAPTAARSCLRATAARRARTRVPRRPRRPRMTPPTPAAASSSTDP
jgi:hypothetical protein